MTRRILPRFLRRGFVFCAACFVLGLAAGNHRPAWAEVDTETLQFTFQIKPDFVVLAQPKSGGTVVNFGSVLPSRGAAESEVRVRILTNTKGDYRIRHHSSRWLQSDKGYELPDEGLWMRVLDGEQGGESLVKQWEQAPREDKIIFRSPTGGGSDSFAVQYRVPGETPLSPGEYFGTVEFTEVRM